MAKRNTRDFDSFISELRREKLSFTMFGKTYEFDKRIPAIIPLELALHDDEEGIPPRVMFRAAYAIFGKATIDELGAHPDFSLDVLSELIKWAFDAINGKDVFDGPVELTEDDSALPERKN